MPCVTPGPSKAGTYTMTRKTALLVFSEPRQRVQRSSASPRTSPPAEMSDQPRRQLLLAHGVLGKHSTVGPGLACTR